MAKFVDVLARIAGALVVLLGGTAFVLYTLLSVLRDLLIRYEASDADDHVPEPPIDYAGYENEKAPEYLLTDYASTSPRDAGLRSDTPESPSKRRVA